MPLGSWCAVAQRSLPASVFRWSSTGEQTTVQQVIEQTKSRPVLSERAPVPELALRHLVAQLAPAAREAWTLRTRTRRTSAASPATPAREARNARSCLPSGAGSLCRQRPVVLRRAREEVILSTASTPTRTRTPAFQTVAGADAPTRRAATAAVPTARPATARLTACCSTPAVRAAPSVSICTRGRMAAGMPGRQRGAKTCGRAPSSWSGR
mmetsp:Transcript_28455/g.92217  ORF Transcript_28455/g.92217 Transcript_28455/m.92217 type:complete len:211 (-) Transcript_28455:2433-3065(-)